MTPLQKVVLIRTAWDCTRLIVPVTFATIIAIAAWNGGWAW